MLVNPYASKTEIYMQIAQKYAELNKIDRESRTPNIENAHRVEISNTPNNYNEEDYKRVVDRLKQRDSEVKAHEQAHASLGQATTPISYNYQTGPDGKLYAVGGHVRMSVSIPDDPQAALHKLDQLQNSATAPSGGLSGADIGIAQTANLNKMLILSRMNEQEESIFNNNSSNTPTNKNQ